IPDFTEDNGAIAAVLKNISDDEDRGIANIPTPGDNMADDGGAVSSETTEMKTPNKELNNINDMFYKFMPRVIHAPINNMNISVETFFLLRYVRKDSQFWGDFYVAPWTRCGPYFVGIFLGYFLVKYERKPKMNK
ncbi:hypothetical protein LSH36_720g00016, partial [Paralvinella palmiformis]